MLKGGVSGAGPSTNRKKNKKKKTATLLSTLPPSSSIKRLRRKDILHYLVWICVWGSLLISTRGSCISALSGVALYSNSLRRASALCASLSTAMNDWLKVIQHLPW